LKTPGRHATPATISLQKFILKPKDFIRAI
jgi:hypothetical protein